VIVSSVRFDVGDTYLITMSRGQLLHQSREFYGYRVVKASIEPPWSNAPYKAV